MTITVDQAREKLLAAIGADTKPAATPGAGAHIHAGNGNLVGDSVRASVLARIGRGERQADSRLQRHDAPRTGPCLAGGSRDRRGLAQRPANGRLGLHPHFPATSA
ncbi:hypothetical protein P4133_10720 [Pseudomonas aeruginosa]|nr:hypothetical protein [Pseudomonas aeruginosa]